MAEVNDEVIDDGYTPEYNDKTGGGEDERVLALKHFGLDPDILDINSEKTASIDELTEIAIRGYRSEQKKIQDKRQRKETPKSETPSDIMTKADYAMEKFLDKNPELSEYRSELSEYSTKKGLSLEEAKTLVLNSDKAKQNRDKTNSLGLSD
jgi:hypothetical protein